MDLMLEGLCIPAQAYHMVIMTTAKHPPRPRDPNHLAKLVADLATGEASDRPVVLDDGRDLAAVLLGRRGGLKGGRARADKLTPEERRLIAQKAARARWGTKE